MEYRTKNDMGFYQDIKCEYGNNVYEDLKIWASTIKQLANFENHKKFLLQCRQKQVIPLHLTRSLACVQFLLVEDNPFKDKFSMLYKKFQFKTLNLEISYVHWKVDQLNNIINNCKSRICETLPENLFNSFDSSQKKIYTNIFLTTRNKQKQKLSRLIIEQTQAVSLLNKNEKWFSNLTEVSFPVNVQNLLALGENFNLPYDKYNLPVKQVVIDVESIIDQIPDENVKIDKRNRTVNIITNYLQSNNKNKNDLNLLKYEKETKIFLKENPDILILKADKGNTTVAMTKSQYIEKTQTLLSDHNTYTLLDKDPTIAIQNKLNKIIDRLIITTSITKDEAKTLKCNNGVFPKMYFQPKIHKDNTPLRPIVSFVGSPTYNLTKYLSKLINYAFIKDEFYTKNSFEIVSLLQGFKVPPNYVMVSLDVISLFTNIPTDLTVQILIKKWNLIKPHCKLTLDEFTQLLNFVFDNSYFNFNGKFYKQIYGLGMGNCLSPCCSDIVMSELQRECISKLPFKLPFFKRYVDDIITCVPESEVETLLHIFNTFHSKLQFTVEKEKHNCIPFLDVLLIKDSNNLIKTDWYHKPTFSERYLNFNSNHSFTQKINIIENLKSRALKLSHSDFHQKNLNNIKSFLLKNNYPKKLIDKILLKKHITPNIQNTEQNTEQPKIPYLKIPFVKDLSEKIARELKHDSFSIAFKNENTLRKLFTKQKTPTPKEMQSNVIYKIPCLECDGVYIGQTKRYLKTRISEHIRSVRPTNLIHNTNKTALAEHFEKEQHQFNFDDTSVLAKQTNYKKRILNEMVEIQNHTTSINKKQDVENLSSAYFNILQYSGRPV